MKLFRENDNSKKAQSIHVEYSVPIKIVRINPAIYKVRLENSFCM